MAGNRKNPNTAKATVWTDSARSDMEGPTDDIVFYMFLMVPAGKRAAALQRMSDWLSEHEGSKQ